MGKLPKRAGLWLAIMLASSVCAFALDPSLDVSQYAHTSWSVRDGFLKGPLHSIAQTSDGYLWLGTEFGLLRFDGVRAVPWQPPAGEHLPSSIVTKLLVSRDGTLWIGTGKGLASWKDGMLTHYPEMAGWILNALVEDHKGTVWAGGFGVPGHGRLCAIKDGRAQCSDPGEGVQCIYEDSKNTLWVSTFKGLWRWQPQGPEFFPTGMTMTSALVEDHEGGLLFGRADGIQRFVNGKTEAYPVGMLARQFGVNSFLWDHGGALWVGTFAGLAHLHRGRADVFRQVDGLSANMLHSVFEDREGNIWVVTEGGLDRFRDFAVPTFSVKEGFPSGIYGSILAAKDGSLWFSAADSLVKWKNSEVTIYESHSPANNAGVVTGVREMHDSGLPGQVRGLFQDSRGRLWVAGIGGFGYMKDNKFVLVEAVPGETKGSIAEGAEGDLWFSFDHALFHLVDGSMAEQIPWDRLGIKDVGGRLAVDPLQGGLWIGFPQGGVAYLTHNRIERSYTTADGLGEGRIAHLRVDREGALWASTEGGLSRIKDGHVATLSTKNGLPCDAIHWSEEGADHSLWLYLECGLVRVSASEISAWIADPNRAVRLTFLDNSDGVAPKSVLFGGSSSPVTESLDGKLWFSVENGVSVLDPRHLAFNKLAPPVHIEQITADRKIYWRNWSGDASSTPPRLPPRVRDLVIDYAALSFVAPEKVRFRYKLQGRDGDWQDVGTRRQAFYSDLAPGNYRFRVAACNNNGVWNEAGDTLDFSIAPAYYQTFWFRALCAAIALALIWALFRLRIRQLQSQERKLRELIETIPTGAWIARPDGSNEFVNQRWVEYTGLSANDTAGLGWQSVVHPEDLKRHMEKFRASLASGEPFEDEVRFRRSAGGEYRWFLSRGVPLRDKHGNILKWYGTVTDIEDRKRVEEALQRSEAYLAEAQRLSHTGSFAYNPGIRKTLFWSEELFRVFKLDPQRGIPDYNETRRLVHPDDLDRVSEECLRGFREKAQYSQDYRLLLHDGTVKHLHVMWHPMLDKDGEVVEYVGTAADVTELKQAEETLRRSHAYLTEAQSLSHTGSFGWKPSSGEIQWSEETYRIFQYDPTTKPTVELVLARVHPQDRALAQHTVERASQEAKDYEHEYRLLMPDGSVKYLYIVAHALSEESGSIEFVGAAMDVTAAKQAEEKLRQSEAELRQLIDAIPQQVLVFDANWNPLFANRRDLEYTGLTLEEAQSKDVLARIFHPDDLKKLEALRQRMFSENAPSEMEARIRGKDGQYRWFLIRDNPLRDEEGRILRWYGTRTDIEDRKRAEETLRQAQTELAHVTRIMTLGELAASIAHEVNQPLSGVVVNANACLRWMAGDSPNLKEAREAVGRIVRDGKRAGGVIARIRALATKTAPTKERLDMNETIWEVVDLARDEVRQNRVTLRTELADDLSPVLGDRVQLQQVVLNLVMNGIEAMGSVEERPRELTVRTQNDDAGQVRVTVQDSGTGLDPQSLERIFDAFYTTKRGGMGMGLAISRSIIQNHGGRLWAVANDGPGVSVQFTIPKDQP
jgi:PAS domain S-box-containing protein